MALLQTTFKATLKVPEIEDDKRLFPHLGGADEVDEGVFPGRLRLLVIAASLEEHSVEGHTLYSTQWRNNKKMRQCVDTMEVGRHPEEKAN